MNGNLDLMLGRYDRAAARYARAFELGQANEPDAAPSRLLQSPVQEARYHYHAALARSLALFTATGQDATPILADLEAALATGGFRQGGYD